MALANIGHGRVLRLFYGQMIFSTLSVAVFCVSSDTKDVSGLLDYFP